jgi:putative nucleotidyltransferase with HDIG domain
MNPGLEAARAALAQQRAWLVGGAVRDRALGREAPDLDLIVEGDSAQAARAVARASGGICFVLSEEFGAWRVMARDRSWQVDVEPLRAGSLEADLALRDFTVNAIAEPLAGGGLIDPLGGLADLHARRLRLAAPEALSADPVRVLRLVRVAVELGLEPEPASAQAAREAAPTLSGSARERVFMELRRIIATPEAVRGLELMADVNATAAVLPELEALRGVEQSRFHHTDVYGHTLEVLAQAVALTAAPGAAPPGQWPPQEQRAPVTAFLAEPLADELTRGEALRWGALLHDVAKPITRRVRPQDGRVTFIGHDSLGADMTRGILERLRVSERLRAHVAALVRHHLTLGFLVHEPQPLARRTVFAYLRECSPVEVDVTLLSVADRLATRGEGATRSIDAHLRLAEALLGDAMRWRAQGPPTALLRGDELARELGIATGPRVGELLEQLAAAQYADEVRTREQALAFARAQQQQQR